MLYKIYVCCFLPKEKLDINRLIFNKLLYCQNPPLNEIQILEGQSQKLATYLLIVSRHVIYSLRHRHIETIFKLCYSKPNFDFK